MARKGRTRASGEATKWPTTRSSRDWTSAPPRCAPSWPSRPRTDSTSSAIGSVPAKGLKKGVVVNIESTVQAIKAAIEQAETMAGCDIGTVYAGIAGSHVRGMNKEGVAAIKTREVQQVDVERVLEQAKAIPLPGDRQVIHVLPAGVHRRRPGRHPRAPVGMSGVRLEARVHLVTAATPAVQNIIKCAERCDLTSPRWCSSRWPAPRRCSARTRRRSASPWSTSAAAPPTSSSTSTARWSTPASSPSAGSTSPTTSRRACAPRWPRPSASRSSTAARRPHGRRRGDHRGPLGGRPRPAGPARGRSSATSSSRESRRSSRPCAT